MRSKGNSILLGITVALAGATCSPGASAAPAIHVDSNYSNENGVFAPTVTTTTATSGTSTSQLDSANFAAATANASVGSVGIGMATTVADGSPVAASTVARIDDEWTLNCPLLCGIIPDLAPVTFDLHFDGTLSPAWLAANAIEGEENGFSGAFSTSGVTLDFTWDGSRLAGTLCNQGRGLPCAPFTFASTTLADGTLSFDDDVSFNGTVATLGFGTELTLGAGWDSSKQPSTLSFMQTFRSEIVSNDPNLGWISDAGQVSGTVSAVPEPGTVPLIGLGLLLLVPMVRNARRER